MIFRFWHPLLRPAVLVAISCGLSGCSGSSDSEPSSPREARMKFAEDAQGTPAPERAARAIPKTEAALLLDLKRIMAREWNVRANKIQVEPPLAAQNLSAPGGDRVDEGDVAALVMAVEDEYDITLPDQELTGKPEDKESFEAYKQLSLRRIAAVVASKRKK